MYILQPHNILFFINLVSFYIAVAPSSHQSKKMIAALSFLISEKVRVYKGFFPLMLMDTIKSNIIFLDLR